MSKPGGPFIAPGTALYQIVDDAELASWAPGGTAVVASLDLAVSDLLDHTLHRERRPPPREPPSRKFRHPR